MVRNATNAAITPIIPKIAFASGMPLCSGFATSKTAAKPTSVAISVGKFGLKRVKKDSSTTKMGTDYINAVAMPS